MAWGRNSKISLMNNLMKLSAIKFINARKATRLLKLFKQLICDRFQVV